MDGMMVRLSTTASQVCGWSWLLLLPAKTFDECHAAQQHAE